MPAPAASIADDFSRPGENPLSQGGNWTTLTLPFGGHLQIDALGRVQSDLPGYSAELDAMSLYTGLAATANSEAAVMCPVCLGGHVNLGLRMSGTTYANRNGYELNIDSPTWTIRKVTAGTPSTLTSGLQTMHNTGEGIWFSATGTTLNAYYAPPGLGSWSLIATTTDSTYTSGYLGLGIRNLTPLIDYFMSFPPVGVPVDGAAISTVFGLTR